MDDRVAHVVNSELPEELRERIDPNERTGWWIAERKREEELQEEADRISDEIEEVFEEMNEALGIGEQMRKLRDLERELVEAMEVLEEKDLEYPDESEVPDLHEQGGE